MSIVDKKDCYCKLSKINVKDDLRVFFLSIQINFSISPGCPKTPKMIKVCG